MRQSSFFAVKIECRIPIGLNNDFPFFYSDSTNPTKRVHFTPSSTPQPTHGRNRITLKIKIKLSSHFCFFCLDSLS